MRLWALGDHVVVLVGGVKIGSMVFAANNHSPSTKSGTSSTNPFGRGQPPRLAEAGQVSEGPFASNATFGRVTNVNGNRITVRVPGHDQL